jgi:DNA repair exonuclease SbcCD ATPase subunit
MSQTELPQKSPNPEGGPKPSNDRFASLNKALKDAEESLKRLAAEAKAAAERSSAFTGAQKDAERLRQWLRERSSNWSQVLKDLERDADKFAAEVAQDARALGQSATTRSATVRGLAEDTKRVTERIKGTTKPKS